MPLLLGNFKTKKKDSSSYLEEIYREIEEKRLQGYSLNNIMAQIRASKDDLARYGVDVNDVIKFAKDTFLSGVSDHPQKLGQNLNNFTPSPGSIAVEQGGLKIMISFGQKGK